MVIDTEPVVDRLTLYRKYSPYMKSCDLIEWMSYKSPIAWAIRFITRRKVNHSSILLRPKEYIGLKDRRFLLEALEGGLVPRLLSNRMINYDGRVWWSQLRATDEQRDKMIQWALMEVVLGKKYDYKSLFANIAGRVSVDANAWFCSEAYTAMLIAGKMINEDTKALRPGEFGELKLHEHKILIYDSRGE